MNGLLLASETGLGTLILNIVIFAGIIVAGGFLIYYLGEIVLSFTKKREEKIEEDYQNQRVQEKQLENEPTAQLTYEDAHVVEEPVVEEEMEVIDTLTDVDEVKAEEEERDLEGEAIVSQSVEEDEEEQPQVDEETLRNERRAYLEMRRRELMRRMQEAEEEPEETEEETQEEVEESQPVIEEVEEVEETEEVEEPEETPVEEVQPERVGVSEEELEKVKESVSQEIATYKDMIYELREELERLKAERAEENKVVEEVEEAPVEETVEEEISNIEETKEEENVETYKGILDELRDAIASLKAQESVQNIVATETKTYDEPEQIEAEDEIVDEEPEERNAPVIETTIVETQFITKDLTREQYLEQLATLQERLRVNEKEFKTCKKEYLPLQKVNKNLERDEKKLRRKEALVAKQKVVLYGVNNYAEIDPERAKTLAEDMNLLEELKASVYNCQEIMKKNASRFPVLERMYTVLKEQNVQLKKDIAEIETKLAEMEARENSEDSAE